MMYLLFILTAVGLTYGAWLYARKHNYEENFEYVPLFLFCFILYFFVEYLRLVKQIQFHGWQHILINCCLTVYLPVGYLYICHHCHLRKMTTTTVGLFLLTLFNLLSDSVVIIGKAPALGIPQVNGLLLYHDGALAAHIHIHKLVEILQATWIIASTNLVVHRMFRQGQHLSNKGKMWFGFISFILVVHIFLGGVNENFWTIPAMVFMHFALHLFFGVVMLYMLAMGFLQNLILDDNEEVVYMETQPKYTDLKVKFERYMVERKAYLNPDMNIALIAREIGTNRTYLAQMMREQYDMTVSNYVNQLRVEEAKKLLAKREKGQKLEEIGRLSGFGTASSFTKVFFALTGRTPNQWIKETLSD